MEYFLFAVLGLVVGSFIAALTYRLPRNISIAKGRSRCNFCKSQIAWYDNVPLISFFILGGRCRSCKKSISLRYPIIEALTAATFLLTPVFYPHLTKNLNFLFSTFAPLSLALLLVVFSVLIAIFVIDLEHQIIPDLLTFTLLGILVFYLLLISYPDLFLSFFAGLLSALLLLAIHMLTKGRGMGLGDVKFAIFGGMFLGYPLFLVWLMGSFVLGAIVGVILILIGRASFGKQIAFGPFLALSLILTALFGNMVLKLFV